MASSSSELFLVDLLDPTSNKIYAIQITSDEFEYLQKDPNLVNLKIQEAKDAELAQAERKIVQLKILDLPKDVNRQQIWIDIVPNGSKKLGMEEALANLF